MALLNLHIQPKYLRIRDCSMQAETNVHRDEPTTMAEVINDLQSTHHPFIHRVTISSRCLSRPFPSFPHLTLLQD